MKAHPNITFDDLREAQKRHDWDQLETYFQDISKALHPSGKADLLFWHAFLRDVEEQASCLPYCDEDGEITFIFSAEGQADLLVPTPRHPETLEYMEYLRERLARNMQMYGLTPLEAPDMEMKNFWDLYTMARAMTHRDEWGEDLGSTLIGGIIPADCDLYGDGYSPNLFKHMRI